MLETRWMLTLVHVADEGSLAGAARRLGYTPSAVSQQMAALETAIGVALFERGAQSIRLTPVARTIVERARGVLAALGAIDSEVRALVSGLKVLLRIGTFPSAGALALPRTLASLRSLLPGFSVTLDEGEPPELISRVDEGSLDASLVYRYGLDPLYIPPRLRAVPLLSERLFLLGPREGIRGHVGDVRLSDLGEFTWLSARDGSAGSRSLARMFASVGIAPVVALRSNNYAMIRGLVDSGEGLAIVPELALAADFPGRVWRVDGHGAIRDVMLVAPESRSPSGVGQFADVAKDVFSGLPRHAAEVPLCRVA